MSISSPVERIDLVRVAAGSSRVRVIAGDHTFRVEGTAQVRVDGAEATVETSQGVTVYVPTGTDIVVGTRSGRVDVRGAAGAVAVVSTSGSVAIEAAERVDARTTSGRVKVDHCHGECRVASRSARVTVGHCGTADVSTTSGRIDLRGADGSVRAHCVSGRIDVEMAGPHDADVETVSGRVEVTYPTGVRFQRREVGDPDPTEPEAACCVVARSVSGRVSVSNR